MRINLLPLQKRWNIQLTFEVIRTTFWSVVALENLLFHQKLHNAIIKFPAINSQSAEQFIILSASLCNDFKVIGKYFDECKTITWWWIEQQMVSEMKCRGKLSQSFLECCRQSPEGLIEIILHSVVIILSKCVSWAVDSFSTSTLLKSIHALGKPNLSSIALSLLAWNRLSIDGNPNHMLW